MDETSRRRKIQAEYNQSQGITPKTVYKTVDEIMQSTAVADVRAKYKVGGKKTPREFQYMDKLTGQELIDRLMAEMKEAATNLEFERAAQLRDEINKLKGKI